MPHPRVADLEALLRALGAAGIPAIVVGGAAAVIHGAPVTTQDVDIVPRLDPGDAERLLAFLDSVGARFRPIAPGRDIAPALEHLAARGQLQLITCHGPLDILCRLHDQRGYHELLPHSIDVADGDLHVRVIDLDTLIDIKRSTGRARDQLVLPLLLALRDRTATGSSPTSPMHPCACCGYLTRSEASTGTFEICPVCWWEDDPVQAANIHLEGGANEVSLARARENFRQFGASDPRELHLVRAPLDHERPPA